MIKRVLTLAIAGLPLLAVQPVLAAEAYVFDNNHTEVEFEWTHFGFSTTSADFRDVSGTLMFDEDNVANSSVEATIRIESLMTGRDYFKAHLLSADFFNWVKHKTATFESTKVSKASGSNAYEVTGDLTIRGITKKATFDVTINKVGQHPATEAKTVGFDATTTVSRSAFDMGMYTPAIEDEITIRISSEMQRESDV